MPTTPTMQVMARLRDHTGPLNFLCIKTIDGATADIGFPAGTELLHNSRMHPVFAKTNRRSPAPSALTTLVRHNSEQAALQVTLFFLEAAFASLSHLVWAIRMGAGITSHA